MNMEDWPLELLNKASVICHDIEILGVQSLTQENITYPNDEQRRDYDPTREDVQLVLFTLQKKGAIKIHYEYVIGRKPTPYRWVFEVNWEKFDEIKSKIKELYLAGGEVWDLSNSHTLGTPPEPSPKIEWGDDFRWEANKFIFGDYGEISFSSKYRKAMFKKLTDAKGHWVKVSELKRDKNDLSVRSTLNQIEERLSQELKEYISIPSSRGDDAEGKPQEQGAYRIKFSSKT